MSDAVNVLVYVGIGGQGVDGSDKEEEIRRENLEGENEQVELSFFPLNCRSRSRSVGFEY